MNWHLRLWTETVCGEFLDSLVERGFRFEEGLLAVIDGSKGLHRAVRSRFKGYVVIQRCRWHKRENVLQYLPKSQRAAMREAIQRELGIAKRQAVA